MGQPNQHNIIGDNGRASVTRTVSKTAPVTVFCPLCLTMIELSNTALSEVICGTCGIRFSSAPQTQRAGQSDSVTHANNPCRPTVERWLSQDQAIRKELTEKQRLSHWCKRHWVASTTLAATIVVFSVATVLSSVGFWQASARVNELTQSQQKIEHRRLLAESLAAAKAKIAIREHRQAQSEIAARKVADQRRREAEHQRRIAEEKKRITERDGRRTLARQLAKAAEHNLKESPHLSVFQASEALDAILQDNRNQDFAASTERVLREALSRLGGYRLGGHTDSIQTIAISPDRRWLVTGSNDKTARLWNIASDKRPPDPIILRGHTGWINAVAISPDSRLLVTAGRDSTAMLWNLTAEDPSANPITLAGHYGRITSVSISSDSRWLVTTGAGLQKRANIALLWDLTLADPSSSPIVLRGHTRRILASAISPDCRFVATAGEDKTIRLHDLTIQHPSAQQTVLRGHEGWISTIAITPNSRSMATGSYDGTIRVWDLRHPDPDARPIVLRGHQGLIETIAISSDSKWLVSGSFDKTARLWNLASSDASKQSKILKGHTGRVRAVTFSPNGHWLATGSFDKTIRLWDLTTNSSILSSFVLRGHEGPITTMAISSDSRWLATGGVQGHEAKSNYVRLWPLRRDTLISVARLSSHKRFDEKERTQMLLRAVKQTTIPR